MKPAEKLTLFQRNTQEVISEEGLKILLKKKPQPVVYCGYETSGEIHLGHLVTITKLLDLQKAGCKIKVLFADWHTWLNRKGDWDFIHKQVVLWKKGFKAAGLTKAEFVLGSTFQRKMPYIDDVLIMSLSTTLNRALRSMQVVARDIEHARVSQVIYPFMQLADIKHMKLDLVVSGIDQRKIHMLGADGMFKEIDYTTPVFLHTPIISSLKGPGSKMSSSVPDSHISLRDTLKDIEEKLQKAYCPEGVVEDNPVLQICQLVIFPRIDELVIERPEKYGGKLVFASYGELEKAFIRKDVHPMDLKHATASYLGEILKPIRKAFGK